MTSTASAPETLKLARLPADLVAPMTLSKLVPGTPVSLINGSAQLRTSLPSACPSAGPRYLLADATRS